MYLQLALGCAVIDDGEISTAFLLSWLTGATSRLRLHIVDIMVDHLLRGQPNPDSCCTATETYIVYANGRQSLQRLLSLLHQSDLPNHVYKLRHLECILGSGSQSGAKRHAVVESLLLGKSGPLLASDLKAPAISSKANLLIFLTVLYIHFQDHEVLSSSVADFPSSLVEFVGACDVSAKVLPDSFLVEDCRTALCCLAVLGRTPFVKYNCIIPLLDLVIADEGRNLILDDVISLISFRYWEDELMYKTSASVQLPATHEINGQMVPTTPQRDCYNKHMLPLERGGERRKVIFFNSGVYICVVFVFRSVSVAGRVSVRRVLWLERSWIMISITVFLIGQILPAFGIYSYHMSKVPLHSTVRPEHSITLTKLYNFTSISIAMNLTFIGLGIGFIMMIIKKRELEARLAS